MLKKIIHEIQTIIKKVSIRGLQTDALRNRILVPALVSSLCILLLLIAVFISSLLWIKAIIIQNSDAMGATAAQMSSEALDKQLKENIRRHASDMTNLIDEKFLEIQNFTRLIATIASDCYTNSQNYRPRQIPQIKDGEANSIYHGKTVLYFSKNIDVAKAHSEAAIMANISPLFDQIIKVDNDITASYIASESGYFIIGRTDVAAFVDYNARDRQWYIDAKRKDKLIWSNVYADIAGRGPTITCAAPVYDRSTSPPVMKGIAGNGVVLANFEQIINAAAPSENATVFLLDSKGLKLFSSDGTGIRIDSKTGTIQGENLKQHSDPQFRNLAEQMISGESGLTEIHDGETVNYIAFSPLKIIDWSLGVIVNKREIVSSLTKITTDIEKLSARTRTRTNRIILFILALLAFLSAAILAFRVYSVFSLAKKIAGPITELAAQVEKISGDNLSEEEINMTAKATELRKLAHSFNGMKVRLREYLRTLAKTTAEKERMAAELDVAAKIQNSMLPDEFIPEYETANFFDIDARMFPAREVGGDFFDFFFVDNNHFAIVIGDVSGKGVSAAMFMVIAKTIVKNHLKDGLPLENAIAKLNVQLADNNQEGMFVTMWVGIFNPNTGKIEYINAGHNPPLVKSGKYSFRYISGFANDLVIGIMEDTVYHKHEITLSAGDALFLYTDGVTEAFNKDNNMYGEERLRDFLNTNYAVPLKTLLHGLYNDIKEFTLPMEQSDDITMLALRYTKEKREEEAEELYLLADE